MEVARPASALNEWFDPMSVLVEDAVSFEPPELVYDFIDRLLTSQQAAGPGVRIINHPSMLHREATRRASVGDVAPITDGRVPVSASITIAPARPLGVLSSSAHVAAPRPS